MMGPDLPSRFSYLLLAAFVCLLSAEGCNKAKYREETGRREKRIHDLIARSEESEARRPEHIHQLMEEIRESEDRRPEHLRRIHDLIEKARETDYDNWCGKGAERRREYLSKMAHGHPEAIPDTWGKMVY